jgi:hypothetical protein
MHDPLALMATYEIFSLTPARIPHFSAVPLNADSNHGYQPDCKSGTLCTAYCSMNSARTV